MNTLTEIIIKIYRIHAEISQPVFVTNCALDGYSEFIFLIPDNKFVLIFS